VWEEGPAATGPGKEAPSTPRGGNLTRAPDTRNRAPDTIFGWQGRLL
jgi:hypothetical protein